MKRSQFAPLFLSAAAALSVAMTSSVANATEILWTLKNVTFNDGATATGSFLYNTATMAYTDIDITTSTTPTLPGSTYTEFNIHSTPRDYGFGAGVAGETAAGDPSLDINTTTTFDIPTTVALGNPNTAFSAAEGVCADNGCTQYYPIRYLTGSAIGVAVPEPGLWAMLILGLGLVGVTLRQRQPALAA